MLALLGHQPSKKDCPQQCSEVYITGGRGLGPEKQVGDEKKEESAAVITPTSSFRTQTVNRSDDSLNAEVPYEHLHWNIHHCHQA
jgi:hypothetical protein